MINNLPLRFNKPMFHAGDLKRIHQDSQEMKPCFVENYAKRFFFISSQYGLNTCIYTIILIKTPQKSKTWVHLPYFS